MNLPFRHKKPQPAPKKRMDEDSGEQVAYEDSRSGRGRRESDHMGTRVEIHPFLLVGLTAVVTIVITIIGYQWKTSQDGMTYEIHQLRTDLAKVLQDNAKESEWKDEMSKWRDQTDGKIDGLDHRIDNLQARQNARPFPWQKQLPSADVGTH